MRYFAALLCSAVLLLSACAPFGSSGSDSGSQQWYTIHVARNGSDTWSGVLAEPNDSGTDGPFATLARAVREVRSLRGCVCVPITVGVRVMVHEGTYYLDSTLVLTDRHSGIDGAPTLFCAAEGDDVTISGGRVVTGFREYRDAIVQADVSDLHLDRIPVTANDPVLTCELFYRGERQILARWPDFDAENPISGGWAYIAGIPERPARSRFNYLGDRPSRWANPGEAQLHSYTHWDWADLFCDIVSVDTDSSIITISESLHYDFLPGKRYYVRNVFEELDATGEWYLDSGSGALYFKPLDGTNPDSVAVTVSYVDTLVHLKGSEYVTFRGFTFAHSRREPVVITGGYHNTIAASTIKNVGGYGAAVRGGEYNGLSGCDISHTAWGGVVLSGGDKPSLTPAHNFVDNCHIHHYGRLKKCYAAAVNIFGVGNRISHCLIHDAPHCAVLLKGNDHVFEYCEVHNVLEEAQDGGAFYLGRDWTERGNIVRYNYFHDLYGYGMSRGSEHVGTYTYASPKATWAVYLDDCACGTEVYGNVFARCAMGALHIGAGDDNIFSNNIVVDSYPTFKFSSRNGGNSSLWRRLADMNVQEPPYRDRYPQLLAIDSTNGFVPERNVFTNNVIWYQHDDIQGFWAINRKPASSIMWDLDNYYPDAVTLDSNLVWHNDQPVRVAHRPFGEEASVVSWEEWQGLGKDVHSEIADPLFVDAANDDYRLREDSPGHRLGFRPIPVDSIGLYESADRATWPVDRSLRRGEITEREWTIRLFDFEREGPWHFVRHFSIAGPFPLEWDETWAEQNTVPTPAPGFTRAYPPENAANHTASAVFETVDGASGWRAVERDDAGYLNLSNLFPTTMNVACYVRCTVISPDERETRISIGSNDGDRVWLNGTLVRSEEEGSRAVPHEAYVPVTLNAGRNTLLVKVSNLGGGWGLYLALEDPERELEIVAE